MSTNMQISSQQIELLYEFANALEHFPGIAVKILDVVSGSNSLGDFITRHAKHMNVIKLSTRGLAALEAAPTEEFCSHCDGVGCESCMGTGMKLPFYIHVYLVDREYGGPEDGGWYFDQSVLSECIGPLDPETLGQLLKDAQAHYDDINSSRPDISSVNSIGRYDVCVQRYKGTVGEVWPRVRPQYE